MIYGYSTGAIPANSDLEGHSYELQCAHRPSTVISVDWTTSQQ